MQIEICILDMHSSEMYANPLGRRFSSVPVLPLALAIRPRIGLNRIPTSLGPNREIHLMGRFGLPLRTIGVGSGKCGLASPSVGNHNAQLTI